MNNLLPCPFCEGEAELHDGVVIIPVIDENGAYIDADVEDTPAWVECAACGAATDGVDSAGEAIAAWNRRAQPSEKLEPLTLDELRGMGGEPIWIKEFPPYTFAGYKVLSLRVVDVYGDIVCEDGDIYDYERYGETWLAYRRKPERSEG